MRDAGAQRRWEEVGKSMQVMRGGGQYRFDAEDGGSVTGKQSHIVKNGM